MMKRKLSTRKLHPPRPSSDDKRQEDGGEGAGDKETPQDMPLEGAVAVQKETRRDAASKANDCDDEPSPPGPPPNPSGSTSCDSRVEMA